MKTDAVSCLLVSDFTVGGLGPLLQADTGPPRFHVRVAPFGQVMQLLLDGSHECWREEPEVAVVWTRPQAVSRAFGRLVRGEPAPAEEILAEVDAFAECVRGAAQRVPVVFVPTWTWPSYDRGLGLLNMSPTLGPVYHLMRMNTRLAEALAAASNVKVLDAGRWVALAGEAASTPKLWHLGKMAFGPAVFKHAAADVKAAWRALRGQARKLLVLDLDDTLWGGVVGDVGWENLQLGGHDPVGESFAAFQRALKALTNRGVILGIVSKNTEAVALEAIDRHPDMVLRRDDFAGWRINWQDKAQNLAELVAELNLGMNAVAFIDDNPAERERVRRALPEVLVPDWPADKLLYEKALAELSCFDTPAISEEDKARTRMYVSERRRQEARTAAQSLDEYLASLGVEVTAEPLGEGNLQRSTQLLNKTNQMNLATRRLTEAQLTEWAAGPGHAVFAFRVADRFDDYGLTGLASMAVEGEVARVADFVLSCRVIGRGVEQAILHVLAEHTRSAGAKELVAEYRPTDRNGPCKAFFEEQSGLARQDRVFVWDLARAYPPPAHVLVSERPAHAV
jgi:FkbH-like protein